VGSFEQYLHLASKSEDIESYQSLLRAIDAIDDMLETLADGVQVYRGLGAFELTSSVAEEDGSARAPSMLDYLIRQGDLEIQVEVHLPPEDGLVLSGEALQRYSRVMSENWRTQAILVVWATKELQSIALDVGQIHRHLGARQERISVAAEDVDPLDEVLRRALEKHRRVFWSDTDVKGRLSAEFDIVESFRNTLVHNWQRLLESAPRRKAPERRAAIESIQDGEIGRLVDLVAEAVHGRLSRDQLQEEICKLSEGGLGG